MVSLETRRRVSYDQLEVLWEVLNSHKDIAMGYNKTAQARCLSQRMWRTVTQSLNSMGDGATKDWKGWSSYWVDLKAKLKKKIRARTEGGPSESAPLNDIEKKFLQILENNFDDVAEGKKDNTNTNETDSSGGKLKRFTTFDDPLIEIEGKDLPLMKGIGVQDPLADDRFSVEIVKSEDDNMEAPPSHKKLKRSVRKNSKSHDKFIEEDEINPIKRKNELQLEFLGLRNYKMKLEILEMERRLNVRHSEFTSDIVRE